MLGTQRLAAIVLLASSIFIPQASAQLAITEVMASASTNSGPNQVEQNSDFWELTNFGTNSVNLTGYRFDDGDSNLAAANATLFDGITLAPGETIMLVQNNVNAEAESVRAWWGANLPASTKIAFYSGNGFSSGGDGVRLWDATTTDPTDFVDSVDFGEAVRGVSFTYDPTTGAFGVLSTNAGTASFKAQTTDDIGSPGRTSGATTLAILQESTSVVANPGDTVSFTVQVQGRPQGSVQWLFNGSALAGATSTTLSITNVQAGNSGTYRAVVSSGAQTVSSRAVQLALQSEATAPVITKAPESVMLTVGQGYTFRVEATGVPQPTFEWYAKGARITDAQGGELALSGLVEQDSGEYAVVARNAVGAVTNNFQVTVTTPPLLLITEVMASSSTNAPDHEDWWELSNLGTFPVSLKGYRFDDSSETIGSAFTFTNDVVIAPGESVVFVEQMAREDFIAWWGAANLPANLQVITYRGNGLSSNGDAVNLWNAAATDDSDKVASVVFSTATLGTSFGYNAETGVFGGISTVGEFGALTAVSGGDIGSPGYIRNHAPNPVGVSLSIARSDGSVQISWLTEAGKTYRLESTDSLLAPSWALVKSVTGTGAVVMEQDSIAQTSSQRFYRVVTQ